MPLLLADNISFFLGSIVMSFAVGWIWAVFVPEGSGIKPQPASPIPICTGWVTVVQLVKTEAWEFLTFYSDGLLHWDQWIWFENSTAKNEETKNPKTNKKKTTKERKWRTKRKNPREKLHSTVRDQEVLIQTPERNMLKEQVLYHNWNHSWPSPSSLLWCPSWVSQRWQGSTLGKRSMQVVVTTGCSEVLVWLACKEAT